MRDFFVVIGILLVIFGGNHLINQKLKETGTEFLEIVKSLDENIESDAIKEKEKKVEFVLDLWEKNEKNWIMIGYHQEINDMEDLLIECYSYYLQNNKEDFDISYRKLKRSAKDLENREKLTFTNIF